MDGDEIEMGRLGYEGWLHRSNLPPHIEDNGEHIGRMGYLCRELYRLRFLNAESADDDC